MIVAMDKKIIAINGSYRKGGINDQFIDAVMGFAGQRGVQTEKIYLTDKHIEFCINCRKCASDDRSKRFGECVFNDDMRGIIEKIESADRIILACPVNFSTVTAVMKQFVERLICYGYWPWEKCIPSNRIKKKDRTKRAVVFTSSGCPAWLARFLMPSSLNILKSVATILGAKVVKAIYFGGVCMAQDQKLNKKQLKQAQKAAERLL
jgi:multimeric flavodoxin WrbA